MQHTVGPLVIELKNILPFRGYTGPGTDEITIERTLRGREQAETIAHEIFHRVQYSYNRRGVGLDAQGHDDGPRFLPMLREGGARLAELIAFRSGRYENDAHAWFTGEVHSLARVQVGWRRGYTGSAYESGLFWKYVAEQHGTNPISGSAPVGRREAETQRILLRATGAPQAGGGARVTIDGLRSARRAMHGAGELDLFQYLPGIRDVPVSTESTWGNFQVALALNGTAGADQRFRFEDAGQWRGITSARHSIAAAHTVALEELPSEIPEENASFPQLRRAPRQTQDDQPGWHFGAGRFGPDSLTTQRIDMQGHRLTLALREMMRPTPRRSDPSSDPDPEPPGPPVAPRMLHPYSMMMFRVTLPSDAPTRLLRVRWEPDDTLLDATVQVITLDEAGELQDLYRHDGAQTRPLEAGVAPNNPPPVTALQAAAAREVAAALDRGWAERGRMDRVFALSDVSEAIIIVGSRMTGGNFDLRLSQAMDQPVLMAATCNGVTGRSLTRNANRAAFDWLSPDIRLYPNGSSYNLQVLILNRGTLPAEDLEVDCFAVDLARITEGPAAWRKLERGRRQETLVTEDTCAQIGAEPSKLRDGATPAPCFFLDDVLRNPNSSLNGGIFAFLTEGMNVGNLAVRIVSTAARARSNPLIIHAVLNGRGPPVVLHDEISRTPNRGA